MECRAGRRSRALREARSAVASVSASPIGAFWLGWFILGAPQIASVRPPAAIGLNAPVWAGIFIVIPALTCLVGGVRTLLGSTAWYMPILCILGFYTLVVAATKRGWPASILHVTVYLCLVLPTDAWRLKAPRHLAGNRPARTRLPAWTFVPLVVTGLGLALLALNALR